MPASRASFFATHRRTILALLFGLAFSAALAYAAPPSGGYDPGDTLDPDCAPDTTDCIVQLPTGGSAVWGGITGTLSDQTDLQDALDDKFDDPTGTTSQYIRGDGTLETSPISYASSSYFGRSSGSTGAANIFIGDLAGGSSSVTQSNFLGPQAGFFATNASQSNFFGYNAGGTATNADHSNFFGVSAGSTATNASFSNFLGFSSGNSATNASNSNFFGNAAGAGAANANNAIFIGYRAGFSDSVNNSASGSSILIGDSTSTGGFSNSIAIGANATNTASNQFLIGSTYTQLNMRGINYTMPSTQAAAAGYVLTNNGSGVLSWTSAGSGGSVTLETNNVTNGSQTLLNLFAGSNITLTDNGTGRVTIAASGGTASPITIQNSSSLFSTGLTGAGSGSSATNAIFLGANAGNAATNAINSNFFGSGAGQNATDAIRSNFFGETAGYGSTNASYANFFGYSAGALAPDAVFSNFIGYNAGGNAANASGSIFIGMNTGLYDSGVGSGSANAANSIFLGTKAGSFTTDNTLDNTASFDDISTFANTSILIGQNTSTGGFSNSIAIGAYAVNTAENQLVIGSTHRPVSSIFIGGNQGNASTDNTIFIGPSAGFDAAAEGSVFVGSEAGYATNAASAVFIGQRAGFEAGDATDSVVIGNNAGISLSNALRTVIIGDNAGGNVIDGDNSIFIGADTGFNAGIVEDAIFIGDNAGGDAENAANAIFIGVGAGNGDLVDNSISGTSILIGKSTSTGGFSNSIALGESATNTASNEFMIGSATTPIDTLVLTGSGGNTCVLDVSVASPSCTSDERLKSDIEDLQADTLEHLLRVRTVSYTWNNYREKGSQIGFIAQDLQNYFPQLVTEAPNGYLTVSYGGMTPILVEAIREINAKITSIADLEKDNSWRSALVEWFASATNGIQEFFAKEIHTDMICVKKSDGTEHCLDGDQLELITGGQGTVIITTPPNHEEDNTEEPVSVDNTPEEIEGAEPAVLESETQEPVPESVQPTEPAVDGMSSQE